MSEPDPIGRRSIAVLRALNLPDDEPSPGPASSSTFVDGGAYRIEIPTVEGPEAFRQVLASAEELSVPVHRVSQGSGIFLLTDAEIREMVAIGAASGVEVCLFVGPRATFDTGAQVLSSSGRVLGASLRGQSQLGFGVEDVLHAADLGVRGVLVGDIGLLSVLGQMRRRGDLPEDFVLKVSISLPVANAATARVLEDLGATSLNLPTDLSVAQIGAIRRAVDVPLDCYIEGADDFGAPVRYYEVPEIVRVAAPVYLKFTVRNAPGTYPSGAHLQGLVNQLAAERVRRASLALGMLARYLPTVTCSPARTPGPQ